MNEKKILNPDEVASWLGIEKSYLYRLVSEHQFPCIKLGYRKLRFFERDVLLWLEKKQKGLRL